MCWRGLGLVLAVDIHVLHVVEKIVSLHHVKEYGFEQVHPVMIVRKVEFSRPIKHVARSPRDREKLLAVQNLNSEFRLVVRVLLQQEAVRVADVVRPHPHAQPRLEMI